MASLDKLNSLNVYDDPSTVEIVRQRDELGRGIGTVLIADAATRLGGTVTWMAPNAVIAEQDARRVLLMGYRGGVSRVGSTLVTDKLLTKELLIENGVSTPRGRAAGSADEAVRFHQDIQAPIVVKPRFGFGGKAVSVNLSDADTIARAYAKASEHGSVVVEEYVEVVEEYRCLTTPTRCVSIVARILPWVEGDGLSTIRELIERRNTSRALVPSTWRRLTPIDGITETYLSKLGLRLSDILPAGRRVTVRNVGGLSSGGEPFECSKVVDAEIGEFAVSAARAIPGLEWGGVDVMVTNDGRLYIVEINSSPDSLGSRFPFYGDPVAVPDLMYRARIESSPRVRSTTPKFPPIAQGNRQPRPLDQGSESVAPSRSIARLLRDHMRGAGWTVERRSPELQLVTRDDGSVFWLRGTSTNADLDIVHRAVRQHALVRKMLKHDRIARPRAMLTRNRNDLEQALSVETEYVLIPARGSWAGPRSRILQFTDLEHDSVVSNQETLLLQSRPSGRRFRAIATPESLITLLGNSGLTYRDLETIASLAVRAVRSVPELRWALVDIVLREGRASSRALVEGICIDTEIDGSMRVLAGSLVDLWDLILNP